MTKKKPTRIAAPTVRGNTGAEELGKALRGLANAANAMARTPTTAPRTRRIASNNPSRVDTTALRVDVAPSQVGRRTKLSPYDRVVLGMTDDDLAPEEEVTGDNVQHLSPPNTLFPERPRAHHASWDPDSRDMTVVFRHGGTYRYYGVTRRDWNALKRNRSFGQTLDRLVIGTYPYKKISE